MKQFRIFWLGQIPSVLANAVHLIVLPLWVLKAGGSDGDVGVIAALATLAFVITSVLARGALDAISPRAGLIALDLARVPLTLFLLTVRSPETIWVAYVQAGIAGAAAAIFLPLQMRLMATLVNDGEMTRANVLLSWTNSLAFVLGPLFGAAVIATTGLSGMIEANALTFAVGALFTGMVPKRYMHFQQREFLKGDVDTAGPYLSPHDDTGRVERFRAVIVATLVSYLAVGGSGTFFVLKLSALPSARVPLYMAAQGCGMLLASTALLRFSPGGGAMEKLLGVSGVAAALSMALWANVPLASSTASFFLLAVFGSCMAVLMTVSRQLTQAYAAPNQIGRAIAVYGATIRIATALAGIYAGFAAGRFGVSRATGATGLVGASAVSFLAMFYARHKSKGVVYS